VDEYMSYWILLSIIYHYAYFYYLSTWILFVKADTNI
jgi:hypothetical protein